MKIIGRKDGISKAETVIVIAVVAIAAALLIAGYIQSSKNAKTSECAVRRATLERSFKALYADEEALRKCKTQNRVLEVTGSDVIQYMIEKDAYTGDKTCVTCGIPYYFRFNYDTGVGDNEKISYTIKFICPCTKGFDGIDAVITYCNEKYKK